jgi:hypothetical protein
VILFVYAFALFGLLVWLGVGMVFGEMRVARYRTTLAQRIVVIGSCAVLGPLSAPIVMRWFAGEGG